MNKTKGINKGIRTSKTLIAAMISSCLICHGALADSGATSIKIGGYVKMDGVAINASQGDQDGHIVDSFYVPGATPINSQATDDHLRKTQM